MTEKQAEAAVNEYARTVLDLSMRLANAAIEATNLRAEVEKLTAELAERPAKE